MTDRASPTPRTGRGTSLRVCCTRRGFALVGGASLGFFTVLALARGTPEDVSWYVAHIGGFLAIGLVSSTRLGTAVAGTALLAYAIALPTLTLLVGFTPLDPWNDPLRLRLFTENPNLLAADLVAVFVAASVLRPRWTWALWLPAVAIAVVLTGSRTALLAISAAVAAWFLLPRVPRVERGVLGVGVALVSAFLATALWQAQREAALPNLVRVSTTFGSPDWTTYGDSVVEVTAGVVDGPWPGTRADRVRVATTSSRLALFHTMGRTVTGTQYVASVYLRSDTPQVLVLSNNMARVPCAVTQSWSRCITPPGAGNGRATIQFRFEVQQAGDSFDVHAFGPQYEVGTEATAYAPRTGGVVQHVVINRFGTQSLAMHYGLIRSDEASAAMAAFSRAPIAGLGTEWATRSGAANEGIPHAHNAVLERLAADGALGMIVWTLLLGSTAALFVSAYGYRAATLIVAVAVLNAFDYTLFHLGTYWACGVLAGRALSEVDSRAREG